ncbi:MAG: hypothetical protein KDA80_23875, partial [Planctomycetaceae bacterium]|nr:hypothetical protein [Planctomycetaceae bacterium]
MPFGKRLLTRLICCLLLASTAISADDSAPARSWDELVKADEAAILKLRDLQAKYQTADTDGKIEILEDYQTTIADLQSNIIPALEKLLPGKLATAEQDLKVQRIASQVVQFALDDNRFSDAKTLAEQILKTNPDDPHATNIVGIAQFADHDFAGAIKTLS